MGALLSGSQCNCVSVRVSVYKFFCFKKTKKQMRGNATMLPQMLTHILLTVSVFRMVRYMVDAADREKVEASRNELHNLLDKPQLQGIPVSVVVKPVCFLQRSCSTITCRSWGFQFVMCFFFFLFRFWFSVTKGISPLL